jgi:hypothetical protein
MGCCASLHSLKLHLILVRPASAKLCPLCAIQGPTNMQRILVFTFCLFLTGGIYGQDTDLLRGRWQIVVMDNGVRYDYKNETYSVSEGFRKWLRDSTDGFWKLEDFVGFAMSCPRCYYVFGRDGQYQEYREETLRYEGFYTINEKRKQIDVIVCYNGQEYARHYPYTLSKGRLIMTVPSMQRKSGLDLELERRD